MLTRVTAKTQQSRHPGRGEPCGSGLLTERSERSLGFRLYREIRDHAPAGWTHAERLVAWVIADDASDETRRSWIKLPEIMARTGIKTESGVRQVLQRLAARGYEFRIPIAKGRDGRPVFAAKGHSLDFLVPSMPHRRLQPGTYGKGDSDEAPIAAKGDSPQSPLSSVKPSLLNGSPNVASRRARASAGAKHNVQTIIRAVKAAVADVHGEREAICLSDEEALGLYYSHVTEDARAGIRDLPAYMAKILGDAPYLDTFLANSVPVCVTCVRWEDECRCPAA